MEAPDTDMIRAANLMVVPNRASDFGNFCHPQKACEALACGVPVVATKTGSVSEFLGRFPHSLYEVGDAADLARIVRFRFNRSLPPQDTNIYDWRAIGTILAQWLEGQSRAGSVG